MRLRYNGVITTLGGALTDSATAVTFASALTHSGGTNVPTVTAGDYLPLAILDSAGVPKEIVHLTAYTAGATSGTITRGQEGTAGAAHASGATVVHAPMVRDITSTAEVIGVAISDEITDITTGVAKVTMRMPFAMTLTALPRLSATTASTSGTPTVDINEGGVSILSTKLTLDVGEKTSTTAAVPAVLSDTALADDAEITFDVDVAGTGTKGLKVWLIGERT